MTWVRALCTSVETCLETCLELPKSHYLIFLYSDLMDQFEGSQRFDDHQWNSSATRESSRVIILKSHLNSTGHSACMSEVRDIFDRQTYVPNDCWQLMCSNILQPWDCCNSLTAPVHNITLGLTLNYLWCWWSSSGDLGVWSTLWLALLPGSLWPRVVVSVRIPSIG